MTAALAGCSWQNSSDSDDVDHPMLDEDGNSVHLDNKEEKIENQAYEIPPVKQLLPHTEDEITEVTPGVATIIWEETDEFDPESSQDEDQFVDELTFELFVYGESPTENEEVELVKVGEKTTHLGLWQEGVLNEDGTVKDNDPSKPYGAQRPDVKHVYFEYDVDKVPKNQQIRFRLRITNNRTGKQEFAHDEGMVYYLHYNDDLQFLYRDEYLYPSEDDPYSYGDYPKSGEDSRILEETTNGYKFIQRIRTDFPSDVGATVPYSLEAKTEDPHSNFYNFISETLHRGDILDIPRDPVELTRRWYDQMDGNEITSIQFSKTVPSEYDYYGRDTYDVLDNPLLTEIADNINQSLEDYSVDNHYARIQSAVRLIQGTDYSNDLGNQFRLPEDYFTNSTPGDCTAHSINLAWLLHHLGYATGLVYVETVDEGLHMGPAVGVPDRVIEEDFPEYLQNGIEDPVEDIGEIGTFDETAQPNELGDLNWIYIEATSVYPIREGVGAGQMGIPLGEVGFDYYTLSLEAVLEPEDPWFETGISNTLPDR